MGIGTPAKLYQLPEREETILDATSVLFVTLGENGHISKQKKYLRYGRRKDKPYFYADDYGNSIEFVFDIGWVCGWDTSKHLLPNFEEKMIKCRGSCKFQPYRRNSQFVFTIVSDQYRERHGTSLKV